VAEGSGQSNDPKGSADAASGGAPALGASFGRGAAFLSLGAVVSRITSFVAQIALGSLLTAEQFGVFGLALGYITWTTCLRGGVVHTYLQTLKPERFVEEAAPYVRLSFFASLFGALATFVLAAVVPQWRPEPLLGLVLLIMGIHAMMPFFNSAYRACMQVRMQFGAIAAVDSINSIARVVVAVGLAYGGWGPVALAAQLLVSAVIEAVVFAWVTRLPLLTILRTPGDLRPAFHTVRWTVLLAIASTAVYQGDYFAAGLFAPTAVVGLYYFTYGLCNQSGYLAATMLAEIVGPTIAKVRDEPARRAAAALRIANALSILLPGLSFGIPVIFPEFERLIWGGRWEEAKWVAFVLSAQVSLLLTTTLLYATRQGMGDFRTPAILECVRAVAVMLGAGAGALVSPTPMGIAVGALAVGGSTTVLLSTWLIRALGAPAWSALRSLLAPQIAAALAALGLRWLADRYGGYTGATGPRDWRWAIEGIVMGIAFVVAYAAICRLLFRPILLDMIGIAPRRIAAVLSRIA
jgi:O-antigen/teichoic acid export membrane protein